MALKKFLTQKHIEGMKSHKYSAVDNSPLGTIVMQPYWNWLVTLFPLTVAPNLITGVALLINTVVTYWAAYYSPTFEDDIPSFMYLLLGVSVFVYQSLDAIDGKQARRTNTSTPLGELFDHGCDAYNCMLLILGAAVTMQCGPTWRTYYSVVAFMFAFYTAHWSTYVTGTLEFGWVDVTEGQLAIMGLHLASYFLGTGIWHYTFAVPIFGEIEFNTFLTSMAICSSVQSVFRNLYNILIKNDKPTVAETSVIQPSIILGGVSFMGHYTYLLAYDTVFVPHTLLFCMVFGTVMAKITCMLVVAHMTKTPLDYYDKSFWALVIVCVNARLNLCSHYLVLVVALVYATLSLLYYSVSVCTQLCDELDICCFSIPHPKTNNEAEK